MVVALLPVELLAQGAKLAVALQLAAVDQVVVGLLALLPFAASLSLTSVPFVGTSA